MQTQYRMLIQISEPDKREYYELEAVNNSWNGRELERQINEAKELVKKRKAQPNKGGR